MKFANSTKLSKTDCLVVLTFEKTKLEKQFGTTLPKLVAKHIEEKITDKDFEPKEEACVKILHNLADAKRVVLFGLGEDKDDLDNDLFRKIGGSIAKTTEKYSSVTICLPKKCIDANYRALMEGYLMGHYKFERYLSKKSDPVKTKSVNFLDAPKNALTKVNEILALNDAISLTRDLINTPAGDMSPAVIESEAKKVAKSKNISIKVLDEKALKKMGAGAIVAVGQGAKEKSRMIILEYKNAPKNKKPYAFIGKGVCFDTGGINLKPTRYIEDMKVDMSGTATVLGLFKALGTLQPKLHVIGVLGVVENAISRDAYKPGDILKALNGKTIEIMNTDAEGRLVLADCLTYTEKKYKPQSIIDFATLTGCALYALGHDISSILSNNDELYNTIEKLSKETDEHIWRLPLHNYYRKSIKGTIADINNTGDSVKAGTITAAIFLEEFVDKKTPWLHCDIAGTAHGDKADSPYKPAGGRGVLIRTMWKYITQNQ